MKKLLPLLLTVIIITLLSLAFIYRYNLIVTAEHTWYSWFGDRPPKAGSNVRGKLETITIKSTVLGDIDRSVKVYLPYNYDLVSFGHFPVIYLLHGFAGNADDWLISAKITDVVEKAIADGKLSPVILVMPDGNGPLVKDSEYLDATAIRQPMESHIINEVVPFIDGKYRTITSPEGRVLLGVSTGGYAAVNLALHRPDLFKTAVSLGGYFINREWSTNKLLDSDQAARHRNNPLEYIDEISGIDKLHIYLASAQNDFKEFISDNEQLSAKLDNLHIDHTFVRVDGGHFWGPWNKIMPDALNWVGDVLRSEI